MEYFSQRNGLRNPIVKTEDMTLAMYSLILECCEQYYDNIAYKYPDRNCPDGDFIIGLDLKKLSTDMQFEIPDLYINENGFVVAPDYELMSFNQYALLDFIEFMAMNIKDIKKEWHSYFQHNHLYYEETNSFTQKFEQDINLIFYKTGMQYKLTEAAQVERITEFTPLSTEIDKEVEGIPEEGLRELLKEAIIFYKTPSEAARQLSIEKLWDAFERLKTYYIDLDKKKSVEKICQDMSEDKEEVYNLLNNEFKELTKIGNEFRIRHHETNKFDIDNNHLADYFFNRCVSLINFTLFYLK